MLKVGLVGVGGITRAHIPAWERMEDVDLVALCDVRPELMEHYTSQRKYTCLDEMLEKEELDILDICLPTHLHVDVAIKAMKMGVHVVCEKPVSLNREDVMRLYQTARENNVRFMVAQVLRFFPEYEFVKEVYESKKYGKLLSGYMSRLSQCPGWSWENWMKKEEESGMVPFDLHIHDLDFMVYAFGVPQKVNSFRAQTPVQDALTAVYSFDGFYITSEASWYAAEYPFCAGFRFQFENAVVEWDGNLKVYEINNGQTQSAASAEGENCVVQLPKTDAYYSELRYFVDCVKNDCDTDKIKASELEAVIDILHSI